MWWWIYILYRWNVNLGISTRHEDMVVSQIDFFGLARNFATTASSNSSLDGIVLNEPLASDSEDMFGDNVRMGLTRFYSNVSVCKPFTLITEWFPHVRSNKVRYILRKNIQIPMMYTMESVSILCLNKILKTETLPVSHLIMYPTFNNLTLILGNSTEIMRVMKKFTFVSLNTNRFAQKSFLREAAFTAPRTLFV